MRKKTKAYRRGTVVVGVLAAVVAAMSYGIAQNSVVTQAEWAVYMVRALRLDWNLPLNPKSSHYIERLNWQSGIEFDATAMELGSSPTLHVGEDYVEAEGPTAEAIYRISTIRPGDYGFRLRLAKGGAVVKLGNAVFDAYQPTEEFEWVDLKRVALDPGDHTVSVLLMDGARAQAIGVTPPCLIAVEPQNGWEPLKELTHADLAVTLAKALELEHGLPAIGSEIIINAEELTRTMEIPLEEAGQTESPDPFWLSSGGSILSAQTKFVVPEAGLYTIEARYFSPGEIRWIVDGCLRAITCPMKAGAGGTWTRVVALELNAGAHDLTVTLPPQTSLDKVVIQQRDEVVEEYLGLASDEGFTMGSAMEPVSRRRAIAAAIRLRSLFERWKATRCKDTLVALEEVGALILAAGMEAMTDDRTTAAPGEMPPANAGSSDQPTDPRNPIVPTGGGAPPVASPVQPGQ